MTQWKECDHVIKILYFSNIYSSRRTLQFIKVLRPLDDNIMKILTQIPIGTEFKVKSKDEIVELVEICFYPTRYKTKNNLGKIKLVKSKSFGIMSEIKKKPAIFSRLF